MEPTIGAHCFRLKCEVTLAPPRPATSLPTETPAQLRPTNDGFDYVRRDVMIPMRDGIKLHTVILVPKGADRVPILRFYSRARHTDVKWWTSHFDDYDMFMQAGVCR